MRRTDRLAAAAGFVAMMLAPRCASAAIEVVCAAASPVIYSGEQVAVEAWMTDEKGARLPDNPTFRWSATVGKISGGARGEWSIGSIATRTPARATVQVDAGDKGSESCEVAVLALPPREHVPGETPAQRSKRLTGRLFLLPGKQEPAEYGLRSYLLFLAPPKNATEQQRQLRAIEAYLQVLVPTEELMAQNVRASEVNVTMLPLERAVELPQDLSNASAAQEAAARIARNYQYAIAQLLTRELETDLEGGGPYLLSRGGADGRATLVIDMTGVDASLIWDWMKWFCWLTAQERSWNEITLGKLALKLRNVLAVTASTTPLVVKSMAHWVYLFKDR
jgi:hypothetical protein